MRLLPPIIIGLSIIIAAVIGVMGSMYFAGPSGGSVDRELRIEFEAVRFQIDDMAGQIATLQADLAALQAAATASATPQSGGDTMMQTPQGADNLILESYAQVVTVAARKALNSKWTVPDPAFLVDLLGAPAMALVATDGCLTVDNPDFEEHLIEADVGPIRVKMLKAATESLAEVFEQIKGVDVDLYNRITSAGALCVRPIRGTTDKWSSHSFGTAVDLNIDGYLDTLGDGKTQLGLTIMADFFEEAGWIWGAGFKTREDSMHFEVSKEKLLEWQSEGRL